jgi:hypothetical protein
MHRTQLRKTVAKPARFLSKCFGFSLFRLENKRLESATAPHSTCNASHGGCSYSQRPVALVPSLVCAIRSFSPSFLRKRSRVRWSRRGLLSRKLWMRLACRIGYESREAAMAAFAKGWRRE